MLTSSPVHQILAIEAARDAAIAQTETFTAYEEELERVEVFKYLGRLLEYDDDDGPTILANLRKARKCWARISKVLRAENSSPRVSGLFYRATVRRFCFLVARLGI